jgi:hypothetical protein
MHCTIRTFAPYESFRQQQIFAQSVLRKESRKLSYSFKLHRCFRLRLTSALMRHVLCRTGISRWELSFVLCR